MATHSLEAAGNADTIVRMQDGRVQSVSPMERLTGKRLTAYAAPWSCSIV